MTVDGPLAVHLARTGDESLDGAIAGYERLAAASTVGHRLVDDPGQADLVLLTQAHLCPDPLRLAALRGSLAWREHRDRTFVIDFRDRPWCAFPGLYASMPLAHLRSAWQRPWLYPWIDEHRYVALRSIEPDLLVSFVGARSHPCRRDILGMHVPRSHIEDTSGFDHMGRSPAADDRRRHFTDILARSKFVLCPRGHGTASFRLQEVLAAGRVPVIISDAWAPPVGPDWSSASICWPEGSVEGLADHLQGMEARFDDMSAAAAALFDRWFSSAVMFDRMIEQLGSVDRSRRFPAGGVRGGWHARLLLASATATIRGRVVSSR